MAERRMFTKKITDSDAFLELSSAAQALYFHLNQGADDDGFNNQVSNAMYKAHASIDDLKILMLKNFIIRFESGVIVIKHWRMHNTLRKDRYTPTNFQEELKLLGLKDNGAYTLGCQTVAERLPQDRLGKDSIDNNIHTPHVRACEEEQEAFEENLNAFCQRWNVKIDNYSPLMAELDFEKLNTAFSESTKFLQVAPIARMITWIIKNASSIYAGKYKDKPETTDRKSVKQSEHERGTDILKKLFEEENIKNDNS